MLPPPCSYHVRNIARGLKITARVKTPSRTNLFSAFVLLLMCCVLLCNNADNIKVKSLQLSVYFFYIVLSICNYFYTTPQALSFKSHLPCLSKGYVCMYVCTYVRTYVCMYVCMYVCVYVCMYVCMYVCKCC